MTHSILIVDDDPRIRAALSGAIADEAEDVRTAEDAETARRLLSERPADVVFTDVRMPGMDGLDLLRILGETSSGTAVILMTAYDDLPTIASAMREGAVDFLVKPLELQHLRDVLRRVLEDRDAVRSAPRAPETGGPEAYQLVGHDPRMIDIYKLVGRVAAGRTNVVIRGESGTGKELIARAIHRSSPYADQPFVAVNCTALPSTLLESELFGHVKGAFTGASGDHRGRFALAGKGTVFLDEIGDTSTDFQAKLLRLLQEHEYFPVGAERPEPMEARILAATHRNLERMVETGDFREDLYYRLRVVEIVVPPLRERPGDIALLADHLVSKISTESGRERPVISEQAMTILRNYSWPGNVRELENSLARAMVLTSGAVIRAEHLNLGRDDGIQGKFKTLEDVEREHVERILRSTNGHKSMAAGLLGISRPRLDRLIKKHGLLELVPGRTLKNKLDR